MGDVLNGCLRGCWRPYSVVLVVTITGAGPSVWLVGAYRVCVIVLLVFCVGLGVWNILEVEL